MAARNPLFTTQYQEFLKESYQKEAAHRLQWYNKRRAFTSSKPRQMEVFRKKISERCKPSEALLEKLPDIKGEIRHSHPRADLNNILEIHAQTSLDLTENMRPPTPQTRRSLYDGITKEGKGRYQYLRKRYDQIPEKKFTFPSVSSWEYGWRLDDVMTIHDIKKPQYGRTSIVQDTFYNSNGVHI